MQCIEYDSIWGLGCDCITQRVINRIAPLNWGISPFAWTAVPNLTTVMDVMTYPELRKVLFWRARIWDSKHIKGTVDSRNGWVLGHHWTSLKEAPTVDMLASKRAVVEETLARRFNRMERQLNDETAKPLLVWVGLGPYMEPDISEWKRLVDKKCDVEGRYYDLEEARQFLEKVRQMYPADIRLLYLATQARKTIWGMQLIDDRLLAGSLGVSYRSRMEQGRILDYQMVNILKLHTWLCEVPMYKKRRERELQLFRRRSLYLKRNRGGEYVRLNLEDNTGYRAGEDIASFGVTKWIEDMLLKIKWYVTKREELFWHTGNYEWVCHR